MRGPFAFCSAAADTVAPLGRAVSTVRRGHNRGGRARALGRGGLRWRPVLSSCRRPGMPPGTTWRPGGLSRYKVSTQQTYATSLPRWTAWCTGRGLHPLTARRADIERWLRTVADSGLSRASVAGHYDAVAS